MQVIDKGVLAGTMYDAVPKTFDYDRNVVIVRTDIKFHPLVEEVVDEEDDVDEVDNCPFEYMNLYSYHEYEFSIKEYYDNERNLQAYIDTCIANSL